MKEIIQQLNKATSDIERLKSLQNPAASGGVTTASLPLAITGSNIAIAVTPTNPGGAVALQATSPGTTQTGSAHVSVDLRADGDVYAGDDVIATDDVTAGGDVIATGTVQVGTGLFIGGVQVLNQGLWVARPGSPVNGQKYFATDRGVVGLEYIWNTGIGQWLGPEVVVTIPYLPNITSNQFTVAANNVWFDIHPDNFSDVYVEKIFTVWRVVTLNDTSNYWTWTVRFRDSAAATTTTATVDTKLFSLATQTPITVLTNTLVTRANFYDVYFDIGKVLVPGTLSTSPIKFYYRLIG